MDSLFDDGEIFVAPLSAASYEPNDTFASAAVITEGTHSIAGLEVDWFQFEALSGTASFSMTPTGASPIDLNMELRNAAGQALAVDFQGGTATESFSYLINTPGTYYLKVYSAQFVDSPPANYALNYDLTIDLPEPFVPGPNDPGETLATATPITEGTATYAGTGVDWFEFDTLAGTMNFSMTPGGASPIDLNLLLWDSAGQARAQGFQGGTATESFSFVATEPGTYYLQVFSAQFGNSPPAGYELNYSLTVDLPEPFVRSPDDPGDSRAEATQIGDGSANYTGTSVDWFEFDTGPGTMSFTLTPNGATPRDLNLELYNSSGAIVQANFQPGTVAESFSFQANENDSYFLKVYWAAYSNGAPTEFELTYNLDVDLPFKTWAVPLEFGPVRNASIAAYDIDNDGKDEIFIGTSKAIDAQGNETRPAGLIVLEDDGTIKWTKTFDAAPGVDPKTGKSYNTTSVSTAPTFSDVNGDGTIDILVGVGADNRAEFDSVGQPGDLGGLYALDAAGNQLWFHQVRDSFGDDGRPDGIYGAPRVFDIDADGKREVLVSSWDHYLYILNGATGAVERELNLHDTAGATPTVADLNRDGVFEIVMPSDVTDNIPAGLSQQGGILHVVSNYAQHNVAGWNTQVDTSTDPDYRGKFEEQSLWSTPRIVDLDRDGSVEIVNGTGNFFLDDRGSYVKVWNADGTLKYRLDTIGRVLASPIIADLDGNGTSEIIAATTSGYVHGWDAAGNQLFATRMSPFGASPTSTLPISRHPVAVDIDADGDLEILVTVGSQLVVLDSDGTQISNLTSAERIFNTYAGSPVVKDIDGDGRLDLVSGGTNEAHDQAVIYRWENLTDTVSDTYRTAEYQENQSLHNIQSFVERFYSTILGRSADPAGLNGWTDLLHTGTRAGADVARGFIFSPEFTGQGQSNAAFVNTLYSAFFNRPADTGGFNGWFNLLEGGADRATVLDGFIGSREFSNLASSFGILTEIKTGAVSDAALLLGNNNEPDILRAGAGNNTLSDQGSDVTEQSANEDDVYGQVYRMYAATLGRAPDTGGFVAWVQALNAGSISLAQAAAGFVSSTEFQNTYGSLSNTDFVELLYQNVLGRAADAGGLAAWVGALDGGTERADVVLGFSESTEHQNNTNARLDAYMRSTGARWMDVLDGGAGDDQMNGGTGADIFVFRANQTGHDTIHGFEPWDELQFSGYGFNLPADAIRWMRQDGANVVFEHPVGQIITFLNVSLSDMNRVRYNLS